VKGQGVVEAIYSVGIIGLILTGVIVLILMTISNRINDFDRKKASDLGAILVERQIYNSKYNTAEFWKFNNIINETENDFNGFKYSIGFTNIFANSDYPKCGEVEGVGVTNCAEVVIRVDWQGKNPQTMWFNRFFTKN
jgi:hypothetical protein